MTAAPDPKLMDRVVNLAKRRGLIFPSSEIYGGFRSTWDYGPLGVLLKRNVKDAWWRSMVQLRDDVVGLDAAILMAPQVWEASGHVATFIGPAGRLPQLQRAAPCRPPARSPARARTCGAKGSFTEARQFNLMFKTHVGPVEDSSSVAYLRPETAQGIFVNYKNVQTTARKKPPFGIAQVGKSFRNEITPGQLHLPDARVRADGDGVLRAARRGREVVRVLGAATLPVVRRARHHRGAAAHPAPRPRGAVALFGRHLRRRVHVPVGLGRARGHREPHRLRPHPAREVLRRGPHLLRPGAGAALRPARGRAGGRRRPRDARVPPRGVHRGRGARREAHGVAARTTGSRRSRSRCCRCPATRS